MAMVLLLLAVVGALRGTWSPCGLSVLATITPVAERARGRSFARSATFYVFGATLGGLLLGAAIALGALGVALVSVPADARCLVAAVLVATCVAADAGLGGLRLPARPRQVDETWVTRFRPWVYAGGFGVQIGSGVSTYVMTNAVYALIVAGALLVAPATAVGLGVAFGVARGLTVLLGTWATSPERLRALHALLARSSGASRLVAVAAQLLVLVACAAAASSPALSWLLGAATLGLAAVCARRLRPRQVVAVTT